MICLLKLILIFVVNCDCKVSKVFENGTKNVTTAKTFY